MSMERIRIRWPQALGVALVAMVLAGSTGCLTGTEFRTVAGPAVQTGVTTIVNGLLDGIFAVIEPDVSSDTGG